MRTRQIEMLRIMLNHQEIDTSKLMSIYDISKRTLFYDIEEVNYELEEMGKLRISGDKLTLMGDLSTIESYVATQVIEPYFERKERQDLMLLSILEEERKTLDDFVDQFNVSKTTIFADIETIREYLGQKGITLDYNKMYQVNGPEARIRDIYLRLQSLKPFDFEQISEEVLLMNTKYDLYLSDYSLFYLSLFIGFIRRRQTYLKQVPVLLEPGDRYLIEDVGFNLDDISGIHSKEEQQYLKCYVLSLSGKGHIDVSNVVRIYVSELLKQVKYKMALSVEWDDAFQASLENHLIASFYRIKFGFPALNPSLNEIRVKYFYMYMNIKNIIRSLNHISVFHKMRDGEIGFVVAYIGGYLYQSSTQKKQATHKVILVCPQGKAVTHLLKKQIENQFSNVEVVGTYSMNQLVSVVEPYDTIITTLNLQHLNNVVKVNPILSEGDISKLHKIFGNAQISKRELESEIMNVIEKYAVVKNKDKMMLEIRNILSNRKESKGYQPMLNEIISENRIQVVESVDNWKKAIEIASKPLLEEGVFQEDYVEAMIQGVEKFGPYIVLADEFALPHASNQGTVKEVAISVLVSKEPVDLLGKPVKVFMVLATVDNESHLKALASLTDVIGEDDKLAAIKEGSVLEILEILTGGDL